MNYIYTEVGQRLVDLFINELHAKRKEIVDAGLDTADDTPIPSKADVLSEIDEFIDEEGEYINGWGVTDSPDYNIMLSLSKGQDFVGLNIGDKVKHNGVPGVVVDAHMDASGDLVIDFLQDGAEKIIQCLSSKIVAEVAV